jgi:hypothetical protein
MKNGKIEIKKSSTKTGVYFDTNDGLIKLGNSRHQCVDISIILTTDYNKDDTETWTTIDHPCVNNKNGRIMKLIYCNESDRERVTKIVASSDSNVLHFGRRIPPISMDDVRIIVDLLNRSVYQNAYLSLLSGKVNREVNILNHSLSVLYDIDGDYKVNIIPKLGNYIDKQLKYYSIKYNRDIDVVKKLISVVGNKIDDYVYLESTFERFNTWSTDRIECMLLMSKMRVYDEVDKYMSDI